jgi:hypothetical protein
MIEVLYREHAKVNPCRMCGDDRKPVVSLGEDWGYEYCRQCLLSLAERLVAL